MTGRKIAFALGALGLALAPAADAGPNIDRAAAVLFEPGKRPRSLAAALSTAA